MSQCLLPLPNLGSNTCKLVMGETRRLVITSQKKEDGSYNTIPIADAAAIANWQTKFDKFNFNSDVLEKAVPTDVLFDLMNEQADPSEYDEGGYYEKLADGNYDIIFNLKGKVPDYIKSMKKFENNSISIWLADDKDQVWGAKNGTNLDPIRIRNISVQNFNLKTGESISITQVKMRVAIPTQMNDLYGVTVADADYESDDDWYSLEDCTGVITTPAVTGCIATITDDRFNEAVTGLAGTGDFAYWNFYDAIAPTVAIPLSAGTSITESPNGTYTINEAAILTTGHTYLLKVTHPRFDIDSMTVVVP